MATKKKFTISRPAKDELEDNVALKARLSRLRTQALENAAILLTDANSLEEFETNMARQLTQLARELHDWETEIC